MSYQIFYSVEEITTYGLENEGAWTMTEVSFMDELSLEIVSE